MSHEVFDVPVVRIQVAIAEVPEGIVPTVIPPDDSTVTSPVLVFAIWKDQPSSRVETTGSWTV
jgi:hypothetical protein